MKLSTNANSQDTVLPWMLKVIQVEENKEKLYEDNNIFICIVKIGQLSVALFAVVMHKGIS